MQSLTELRIFLSVLPTPARSCHGPVKYCFRICTPTSIFGRNWHIFPSTSNSCHGLVKYCFQICTPRPQWKTPRISRFSRNLVCWSRSCFCPARYCLIPPGPVSVLSRIPTVPNSYTYCHNERPTRILVFVKSDLFTLALFCFARQGFNPVRPYFGPAQIYCFRIWTPTATVRDPWGKTMSASS